MNLLSVEVQCLTQFNPGRFGKGHHGCRPVEGGRQPSFEKGSQLGGHRGEHGRPEQSVVMVEQHHPGPMGPHRGQERHAIPDLDDGVSRAVSAHKFGNDSSREDRVTPSTSYYPVAVAAALLGQARGSGSPNRDL